jgi:hypothetical protein
MSPEHEAMIAKNVRRGMGLRPCIAIWNPRAACISTLRVWETHHARAGSAANMYNLNQDHQSLGIQSFSVGIDEVSTPR